MRLIEYLKRRQGGQYANALTRAEALLCGILWPLRKGWAKENYELEVDEKTMLVAQFERKNKKAKNIAYQHDLSSLTKKEKRARRKIEKANRKHSNQYPSAKSTNPRTPF